MEDNLVVGKADFVKFNKPVKVEDKNLAFDGSYAKYKVVS